MLLAPGHRLGSYEIVGTLGAGGMGEVYRARDTSLNREVAIKVLPAVFAADPDRLTRLAREARTLAALNHPNIAHVHGLDDTSSGRALVMELVEGEDLADRVARGALPLTEAVPIARSPSCVRLPRRSTRRTNAASSIAISSRPMSTCVKMAP